MVYQRQLERMRVAKLKENMNMEGGVKCMLCQMVSNDLTSHISRIHCSIDEYKTQFPNAAIRSEKYLKQQAENIKGDKNPAYQHGGKFSPYSEKFIRGKDPLIHQRVAESRSRNNNDNTQLEYYLKRGMSQQEATEALSKRQKTFSLEKCVARFGKEKGTLIWKQRQEKWLNNYTQSNYSNISQDMFWKVFERLNVEQRLQCKFATLAPNLTKDESGLNHEKIISIFRVDFILGDRIIEFDGDYWHSDKNRYIAKNTNKTRDQIRDEELSSLGYSILRVKEHQYKQDPEKVINECICFLNK